MQSTNKSNDKTRKICKRLTLASAILFLIAIVSIIISAFTFSTTAFLVAQPALLLGIAFAGISWNISRIHNKSTAVRVIAKISSIIDVIAGGIAVAMIALSITGTLTDDYTKCNHDYADNLYSQNYVQCIENADNAIMTFYKITFVVIILAVAGEIIGRFLAHKPTKKLTNVTRWTVVALAALLSLAIIIYIAMI